MTKKKGEKIFANFTKSMYLLNNINVTMYSPTSTCFIFAGGGKEGIKSSCIV